MWTMLRHRVGLTDHPRLKKANGRTEAVLVPHRRPQSVCLPPHCGIVHRNERRGNALNRQRLSIKGRRPDAQVFDTSPPEGLTAEKRDDRVRQAGPERRCGGALATMMDRRRYWRQQLIMGGGCNQVHIGG